MVADEPLTRPVARRVNGFRQFQLLRYYAAACPENGVGTHSGVVFVFSPYESSRILRICAPLNIARAMPSNIEVIFPAMSAPSGYANSALTSEQVANCTCATCRPTPR
jgi:hypothetical protein